MFYNKSTTNRI